jgi:hypothetical protein
MGNDQPLTYVSEYWHSDQLGINLLSIRTSPFFGKQTFTITEITAADPDPQLFALLTGFKVNDQRKNPRISLTPRSGAITLRAGRVRLRS